MPVLDMKEIPEAHVATGVQDTFELFARDFLKFMGYRIVSDPDRGPDGGKDVVVEELRTGVGGETRVRWLVSCKHKASSGKAVSTTDDSNIGDRLAANKCKGFIGFYSTLASSGLNGMLSGIGSEYQIYDREKIESQLLHSAEGLKIAQRYFPISLNKWTINNPKPSKIFGNEPELKCSVCGRDLFEQDDKGIVTLWQKMGSWDSERKTEYVHIRWTCRGHCDGVLRLQMRKETLIDGWEDVSDVMTPIIYIKWVMTVLNEIRSGVTYSEEAFDSMKELLLQVYPFVARHSTASEEERIKALTMIPAFLGGLGYESKDA